MASFKAKFPVLQELFAKNHREGPLPPPPPSGARVNSSTYKATQITWLITKQRFVLFKKVSLPLKKKKLVRF